MLSIGVEYGSRFATGASPAPPILIVNDSSLLGADEPEPTLKASAVCTLLGDDQ